MTGRRSEDAHPTCYRSPLDEAASRCRSETKTLPDITHIGLRVSKEPAILHDGDGSGIHERRHLTHRLTKPSLGAVNWRPPGNGGGFQHVCTRFNTSRRTVPSWLSSSPPMIPRILATLVLDGARRYAPALVEMPPEALLPRLAETPAAGRGELGSVDILSF